MARKTACIFQSGYYNSTVTDTSGSVREIENSSYRLYGYGTGGSTAKLLAYLVQQFGPVTSFSGSYKADRWTLNINRSAGKYTITLFTVDLMFLIIMQTVLSIKAHVSLM